MKKIFLLLFLGCVSFSVRAQYLDVEKIEKPRESRSVLFQASQSDSLPEATDKLAVKKVEKPRVTPKKNTPVPVTSFFKPGDTKIMAVVNGEAISSADVDSYGKLFLMNTGVPLNNKTKPMILNKVLRTAIDDKIKAQEVEKNQLTLSSKDMSAALSHYETSRKIGRGQLEKVLKNKGINPEIFKNQLQTEILWARLIRRKMMMDSSITQREVEDAINRSQEDMKTPKYKVSEIVIPVAKGKDIDILVDNIRRDGLFNMYAAQFSQSPSSANGGDLGWIKEGQLAKPLENKIKNMRIGQVSQPVKYENNYYILRLDDKFVPAAKPKQISYDDMKNVLETERLEGYSAKYLQNLRQKSVIEFKG
ncbi:MAG: peptidylprolyl isomerase [Alphaproteobacteria bacterium]|nr:peptidylprolyl isomerase [Alphaproteobacteria bacterium]